MKERPILFKGPLVRAILDGTKTQTRRLVDMSVPMDYIGPAGLDNDPESWGFQAEDGHWYVLARGKNEREPHGMISIPCPHGEVGDRLWVREAIRRCDPPEDDLSYFIADGEYTRADCWPWKAKALPSIHCPRGLSRIDLEITEVRVQRLQDITEEDARAEGFGEWIPCDVHTGLKGVRIGGVKRQGTCREHFSLAWDAINGARASWESNPWVWAISFRRVRP